MKSCEIDRRCLQLLHTLPVELVRLVFEFGASQSQVLAANLACVSRTVRGWITPLLYETVILKSPRSISRFYETTQSAKSSFASHVKSLYLPPTTFPGVSPSFKFLAFFPALQHLAISSSSLRYASHPSQYQCPSPRPTSITITGRLGRISFEHPMFQNCTHLYLADDVPSPCSLTSDNFPSLTHLACGYRHGSSSTTAITCLPLLLPRKPSLAAPALAENTTAPQSSSSHTPCPVDLQVLMVEMYLSDGQPDATMFVMECLGLGKKALESNLRADPRLVLRPGITLTPGRWREFVVNDALWTAAEQEVRIQSRHSNNA